MYRRESTLFLTIFLAVSESASAACVVGLDAVSAAASSRKTVSRAPYSDSALGLKNELKDMRDLARKGTWDQLQAMIADFEIPDAKAWYLSNFGTPGLETATYYEKNLGTSELRLKSQLIEFARQEGYFSAKKQNAKKVYPGLVTAPDVYLAAWKYTERYEEYPSETPIGYFFFVDGKFRWDSTITWVRVD